MGGFALIKVVSSVFIAETHRICAHDKELKALEKNRDEETHKQQLREILSEVDTSHDGLLSWQELEVMLESNKLQRWVEKMGINPLHLMELFKILRKGGGTVQEGYVEIDELVSTVL